LKVRKLLLAQPFRLTKAAMLFLKGENLNQS
jgi:hypothetical protein